LETVEAGRGPRRNNSGCVERPPSAAIGSYSSREKCSVSRFQREIVQDLVPLLLPGASLAKADPSGISLGRADPFGADLRVQ
jgi:hypothetical protein